MMHGTEQSDSPIVPRKPVNKAGRVVALICDRRTSRPIQFSARVREERRMPRAIWPWVESPSHKTARSNKILERDGFAYQKPSRSRLGKAFWRGWE
jgi:hypothetical protein